MIIVNSMEKLASICDKWVLSIGNFDGFHKGHQQIVSTAMQAAKAQDCKMAVITFRPHPAAILRPERAPGLITNFEMKCKNLGDFGVDAMVAIEDSYALLNMSPEKFVDDFLMKNIKPAAIVEGDNFHFGYGRSGSVQTLQRLGQTRGFDVVIVQLMKMVFPDGQQRVSSTLIREFIESGRVEDAATAMGRDFQLVGEVITGRGIGRKLGFPTANINPTGQIIPSEGVYAGWVTIADTLQQACQNDGKIPAVYSIGRAKTFIGDKPLLIEAHILAENEQVKAGLYGKWLNMDFAIKVRDQQRFEDVEQLKKQIAFDCQTARDTLAKLK